MDVVGSEIGQKMRSAIKAKLTELGCYVDDELPDYVMVMVANKRTQSQMEDDLQLFLGDNTELFVNWLHQVLKKLQEVTIAVPLKSDKEQETSVSKEKKSKDKKDKDKSKKDDSTKKSKKKDKTKSHHKKQEKKSHKSKKDKKRKSSERMRPNIPPLLMNIEKESEPSITDVFAGQILKNHGVLVESHEDSHAEMKPIKEIKRPILPIIDPATINQPGLSENSNTDVSSTENSSTAPRIEQLKEINEIEAKIQGLKQKLVEQLDSMSDDEDFLNIRTEAEDLMNDFAEDVVQEISQPTGCTPPITISDSPTLPPPQKSVVLPLNRKPIPTLSKVISPKVTEETLPQIELNLPKRPIRERLGARQLSKKQEAKEKDKQESHTPERLTPERELELYPVQSRSRIGSQAESHRNNASDDSPDTTDSSQSSKRVTSKVSVLDSRSTRVTCASVVRVRPRPRAPATASNLLLRAVADAHKSLINIPPKIAEPQMVKRALVLPMRRTVDPSKIVIQVPGVQSQENVEHEPIDDRVSHRLVTKGKDVNAPITINRILSHSDYLPSRTASRRDDCHVIETINIHNTTIDKDKDTQFIVTMDGYHPNAFLAKKLLTEGLLDDDEEIIPKETPNNINTSDANSKVDVNDLDKDNLVDTNEGGEDKTIKDTEGEEIDSTVENIDVLMKDKHAKMEITKEPPISSSITQKKRLSDTSEDSDIQVIITNSEKQAEKRQNVENAESGKEMVSPPTKKRRASPIVFDVKKDIEKVRERTVSAGSDSHVILSTVTDTHKYDSVPSLSVSQAERKQLWCREFPLCHYGPACAFQHPRCKFAAACTRRGCVYSHTLPAVASHVVAAANYKTISSNIPNMCKFYPNCVNPACHFYHPKPCRFGKACTNKLECNFYHNDVPAKWKYSL